MRHDSIRSKAEFLEEIARRRAGAEAVDADAQAVWDARFLKLVVYDDNEAARGFYNRLGFVASVGETTLTLNDRGLSALKDE